MDEFDLPDLLAEGAPEARPEVLGQIVRRHGRRRVRRARIATATAVVVAFAGAGIGIGLSRPASHTLVAGARPGQRSADRVPAGLQWAIASGSPPASAAGPGVFGWLGNGDIAASSAAASRKQAPLAASPRAALVTPVPARSVPGLCARIGCGPFYPVASLRRLFERTVDGVTIEAQLGQYGLPMGRWPPGLPLSGKSGTAHVTAGTGHAITGSTAQRARASASPPVRVASRCFSWAELIVTVSRGHSAATLAVPGGASSRPFSVLASAEVNLAGAEVVLAVTHTSSAVRTVTSQFPGGGDDHMAPVDGWSVLVHQPHRPQPTGSAGAVTLVASSGTGSSLEQVKLPATGWLATPVGGGTCRYLMVPPLPIASPPAAPPPVVLPPRSSPGVSPMTGQR